MKYTLDTNVCIRYLKGKTPQLIQKLMSRHPSEIFISTVVYAELLYGALRSDNPELALLSRVNFSNHIL